MHSATFSPDRKYPSAMPETSNRLVRVLSAAVNGLETTPVQIEISTSTGKDFFMVGLPDSAVRESRTRVQSALRNTGFRLALRNTVVNFAPADVRKEGTAYDLPLALGLLGAYDYVQTERFGRYMFVGELGLDGSLRPVRGALPIAIMARRAGYEGLIVPHQNVREAGVVDRLAVYGATTLTEVVAFLNGRDSLRPVEVDTRGEFYARQQDCPVDFADVRGQENVKRALEVAAAGGHNILLVGSPGCGKSMMAKRLPSILPPLTLAESLETTQIHSIAGRLPEGTSLIAQRPFRSPHHTISDVALIGGGSNFQPGEISLAHNGVLFLDELPEFSRSALETLRQPLEDRQITISRAKYNITLPCSFMLVASMNPCPCGYYNHPTHACSCLPGQIKRYVAKISGPLLDRVDIQVEVTPVPFTDLNDAPPGDPSAAIRNRVVSARQRQAARFADVQGIHCNAQMDSRLLRLHAQPDTAGAEVLRLAMEHYDLSARAYDRILKVARTIADLDGSDIVGRPHIPYPAGSKFCQPSRENSQYSRKSRHATHFIRHCVRVNRSPGRCVRPPCATVPETDRPKQAGQGRGCLPLGPIRIQPSKNRRICHFSLENKRFCTTLLVYLRKLRGICPHATPENAETLIHNTTKNLIK